MKKRPEKESKVSENMLKGKGTVPWKKEVLGDKCEGVGNYMGVQETRSRRVALRRGNGIRRQRREG